jgi:hypothetical protein
MVRGNRIGLLHSAIQPLKSKLTAAGFARLKQSLSLVFGTEAFVVLKDIWGLDGHRAQNVALWTCHALIQATIAENGKAGSHSGRSSRHRASMSLRNSVARKGK